MHGVGFPCSTLLTSSGLEILGGMQNSGMVSGVMMLGHSVAFLAFSAGAFSPNMLPILKLYSVAGRSKLVFSTEIRIFSTTHMGSTLKT